MSRIGSGLAGASTGAGVGSAFGPIGTGIGAGVGAIAGFFGGNNNENKSQISWTRNEGDEFNLDPEKGLTGKKGKYLGTKDKIPTDFYLSQLQNEYNIAQQFKMAKYQNELAVQNWNMQNEYNTPAAQAARLKAAGINPYLAMAGDGSVGQAQGVSQSNQSVNGSIIFYISCYICYSLK